MQTLRKLRNRDTTRIEEPINSPNQRREKHAAQLEDATTMIESVIGTITDDSIPIGHQLRKQKILGFKAYAQATGFLIDSVDLSELNERQLADYAMIAEKHNQKQLDGTDASD